MSFSDYKRKREAEIAARQMRRSAKPQWTKPKVSRGKLRRNLSSDEYGYLANFEEIEWLNEIENQIASGMVSAFDSNLYRVVTLLGLDPRAKAS